MRRAFFFSNNIMDLREGENRSQNQEELFKNRQEKQRKTTMKIRISLLPILSIHAGWMAAAATANDDLEWFNGGYGTFLQCPSDTYAFGYCSSGRNPDCGKYYTKLGCGSFPKPDIDSQADGFSPGTPGTNGWVCAKYGVNVECPPGQVMLGACGSGKNRDCKKFCKEDSHSGVLCGDPPSLTPVGKGSWSEPLKYGHRQECPENQAICGICQSGENRDCSGGHWRMRCCGIGSASVTGSWMPLTQLVTSGSYEYQVGTSKSETETKTKTWSGSVTSSVEAGLTVKGLFNVKSKLSATLSHQFSQADQSNWSVSKTEKYTATFSESHVGMQVWRWNYDILDAFDNSVTTFNPYLALTPSKGVPPKCVPGYMEGGNSQICVSEAGTLPGFNKTESSGIMEASSFDFPTSGLYFVGTKKDSGRINNKRKKNNKNRMNGRARKSNNNNRQGGGGGRTGNGNNNRNKNNRNNKMNNRPRNRNANNMAKNRNNSGRNNNNNNNNNNNKMNIRNRENNN